jgi:hypothetical protein
LIFDAPLVHKICEFYKKIYALGIKMPKRDRFGIYLKAESVCLEIIDLSISAAFARKQNKLRILENARIKIEILKRLMRLANELSVITQKDYLQLENSLQEISRMTNGWIKYLIPFNKETS